MGVPLVALKLGRSALGKRFALSHSGALAGTHAGVYEGDLRQARNIACCRTLDELSDTLGLLGSVTKAVAWSARGHHGFRRRTPARRRSCGRYRLSARSLYSATTETTPAGSARSRDAPPRTPWTSTATARWCSPNAWMPVDAGRGGRERRGNGLEPRGRSPETTHGHGQGGDGARRRRDGKTARRAGQRAQHGVREAPAREFRSQGIPVLMSTSTGLHAIKCFFQWHERRNHMPCPRPRASLPARALVERGGAGKLRSGALRCPWTAWPCSRRSGARSAPNAVVAKSASDAVDAADRSGYPVAMKTANPAIPHKTEAGGVALSLRSGEAGRRRRGLREDHVESAAPSCRFKSRCPRDSKSF